MRKKFHYILFNKPHGVLCQFTDSEGRQTLADFGPFPPSVYPAGRLDMDSEGLVLLTDDGELKHGLLEPKYGHPRTYLVQVEHIPTRETLARLEQGVLIEGRRALPAKVRLLSKEPRIFSRPVPIRFRKSVPTAWLEVTLHEGRNRQVRKMTAAVGHPTLRLIRTKIGNVSLGTLQSGEQRVLTPKEIQELRKFISAHI